MSNESSSPKESLQVLKDFPSHEGGRTKDIPELAEASCRFPLSSTRLTFLCLRM